MSSVLNLSTLCPDSSQLDTSRKSCIVSAISHSGKRKRVHCTICLQNNDTAKRFCHKGKLPAIATENGTEYRKETIQHHIESTHTVCKK